MPYKDPERKREWEREHREQRNARRRIQRLNTRSEYQCVSKPAPVPVSGEKPGGAWKTFLGLAVGIGVVLLAIGGVSPHLSSPRSS